MGLYQVDYLLPEQTHAISSVSLWVCTAPEKFLQHTNLSYPSERFLQDIQEDIQLNILSIMDFCRTGTLSNSIDNYWKFAVIFLKKG